MRIFLFLLSCLSCSSCYIYTSAGIAEDPPDSLLILLADCNFAPGLPPISDKESDEYLERAIRKKITYEGAEMMRGRARMKGDKQEEAYWDIQCNELKRKNIHMDTVIPDVLLEQNRG